MADVADVSDSKYFTNVSNLQNVSKLDRVVMNKKELANVNKDNYSVTNVLIDLESAQSEVKASATTVKADLRQRGSSIVAASWHDIKSQGFIAPFKKPHFTVFSKFFKELRLILCDTRGKRVVQLICFILFCTTCLFSLCRESNSIALTAYTYLSIFDLLVILTCLLSIWVEQQRPTSSFTFGYGRFEVLAAFSCIVLGHIGALFVIKECMERLILREQPIVDGSRMFLGCGVAFLCRLLVIYCTDSKAWSHVITSSKSSWLQQHATEFSENVCQVIPGLSRFLLPRVNPFILIACMGAVIITVTQFLVQLKGYHTADTLAAICIALLTLNTMFPMLIYTGLILLQTTPSHILSQLDKCLREAATLDGVLEFRNEHFWTLSFGVLVGSLHVRVRRDANEQLVLAHLTNRLSSLVSVLTIQVFKDDWSRNQTTLQILNDVANVGAFATAAVSATPSAANKANSTLTLALPPHPAGFASAAAVSTWNASSQPSYTVLTNIKSPVYSQSATITRTTNYYTVNHHNQTKPQ